MLNWVSYKTWLLGLIILVCSLLVWLHFLNHFFSWCAGTTVVSVTTGAFVCVDSTPRPPAVGERLLVSQRSVEFVFLSGLSVYCCEVLFYIFSSLVIIIATRNLCFLATLCSRQKVSFCYFQSTAWFFILRIQHGMSLIIYMIKFMS